MALIDIAEVVKSNVVPVIVGGVGGYWLKYVFDIRGKRHTNRCDLIAKWREELCSNDLYYSGRVLLHPRESVRLLRQKPSYAALEPRLSPEATKSLQKWGSEKPITLEMNPTDNPVRTIIVQEIARLEKEWRVA